MNIPKVSIIVPVHNAGTYFEECLNSLIKQTLREIEIILILDCPTDGSDKVAEAFSKKDDRIKLIYNSSNLHAGLSRNEGLKLATGKYIGFCDNDDYCEPNMYELLYQKAENESLDVVNSNYFECIEGKDIKCKFSAFPQEQFKQFFLKNLLSCRLSGVIWNHLFNANFLRQHKITFLDTKKSIAEDCYFLVQSYFHANKVEYLSKGTYYHRIYPESTGANQGYRSMKNTIAYFEHLRSFLETNNIYQTYQALYLEGFSRWTYTTFRRCLRQLPLRETRQDTKLIKKNKVMKENINQILSIKEFPELLRAKPMAILFLFMVKLGA